MSDWKLVTDPARLAAVNRVLPMAHSVRESLDRLAELAATVLDSAAGAVIMVGDRREYVVGRFGAVEWLASERAQSFEAGFFLESFTAGVPLYIDDTASNPAFAARFAYRAYAECPLRDPEGQLLGTLSVADTRPHQWRPMDRRALEALAESVISEIVLYLDIDRRQQLLTALDAAPAAIALARGPKHIIEYFNAGFRNIFGDLPLGVPWAEALAELPEEVNARLDMVLKTGEVIQKYDDPMTLRWPGELQARKRYFDFSYAPIHRDLGSWGVLMAGVEVTDRVQVRVESERRAQRRELLAQAGAALYRSLDPAAELQELARVAVPGLADFSTVHLLSQPLPPGRTPPLPLITERVAVAADAGLSRLPVPAARVRWSRADDPLVQAISRGEMFCAYIDASSPPDWSYRSDMVKAFADGLCQLALAPVVVEHQVVAMVAFGTYYRRPRWDEDDFAALNEITRYAGFALDRSMSYQRTRHSALVLQRSLLTAPPTVPGLRICARYQPAGHDEVGGDWYDVFDHKDRDGLSVVIGDVMGHDINAAASMGQMRATLRALALDRPDGPAATLRRLAAVNTQLAITAFTTLVYGQLTRGPDGWRLRWASAGHVPPLLLDPVNGARVLPQIAGTAIIESMDGLYYAEGQAELPAGSTLLLYTDGLVERPGTDIGDNIDALARSAATGARHSVELLCDEILSGSPTDDDIALLALRIPF
ncbi:SpoIIE family protein phosphatase [Streptomyces sp. AK02-01A]|uniref:SpoIIE family protein phosphatase n=1 Tax=Streptomyces sp. AK02-01A TaxID=3028648 RepID=UPI0029A99DCB|nr:SpoIIE family protein phosphatase [Streptomyces sp. AK02-01A]MDX3853521.1 SpoIIE family protein phosphatase [Streptomyces sp. AK02-01A]